MELYNILSDFVESEDLNNLIREVKDFNSLYYTEENLSKRCAYLADRSVNRYSNAYVVALKPNKLNLPYIDIPEQYQLIKKYTLKYYQVMNLPEEERTLFNMQEYFYGAECVPVHFDGELLKFVRKEDGSLDIQEAIRPSKVGVVTLVNNINSGTRIHSNNIQENISCTPGSILLFDNLKLLHSVDPVESNTSAEVARMTIGWRSLNSQCSYYTKSNNTEEFKQLDYEDNLRITKNWLDNEWPIQWERIRKENLRAAF